jgi:hypothetical protein
MLVLDGPERMVGYPKLRQIWLARLPGERSISGQSDLCFDNGQLRKLNEKDRLWPVLLHHRCRLCVR